MTNGSFTIDEAFNLESPLLQELLGDVPAPQPQPVASGSGATVTGTSTPPARTSLPPSQAARGVWMSKSPNSHVFYPV